MASVWETSQTKDEVESGPKLFVSNYVKKLVSLNPEKGRGIRFGLMAFCLISLFGIFGLKITHLSLNAEQKIPKSPNLETELISRGSIFDRNGKLLAVNVPGYAIYAHPNQIPKDQVDSFLNELAAIEPPIDFNRDDIRDDLLSSKSFIWVSTKVSSDQSQAVNQIAIKGVYTGKREIRVYPNGALASHVLGGVKFGEQHSNKAEILGLAGVERYFNDHLNDPTASIRDVYLSIDINAQNIITNLMRNAMDHRFDAKGGSAVLMNVHSGEILALVSLPDFDPHNRKSVAKANPDSLFNRVTQGVYEMGSTFKLLTMIQAIDKGLITPETVINVDPVRVLNKTFSDIKSHAPMPLIEAFQRSKNTAAIRTALLVGQHGQREFYMGLGFDRKVSIQLPEVTKPLFPDESSWTELTMATVSFGYGVSITPLHLAKAYAIMVNGGQDIQPTIVKSKGTKEGEQLITANTSKMAIHLLQAVVEKGTAQAADIKGFQIGGKTGTTEKIDKNGQYLEEKNMVTFASIFPGNNPNYVLIVRLDEASTGDGTKHDREAGRTVVPLTKEIISRLIPILGIKPAKIEERPLLMASN